MSFDQAFFERKVRTLFSRFDVDGSGTIEEGDFEKWADKLISFGNLDDAQKSNLKENIKTLWRTYFAPADVNGDGSISWEELANHIKQTINDESKRSAIKDTLPLIFDAIDSDKSESVTIQEFGYYFKSLNINDQNIADQVFSAMDSNGDKTLNKSEFAEFGRNFFFNQDQNDPSRLFFGPLVD